MLQNPFTASVTCVIAVLVVPAQLTAQAWTPAKGELDLALTYQNLYTTDHLNPDGSTFDDGRIHLQATSMEATYGVTDRLAVKLNLPYAAGKYMGDDPHQVPIDGGAYHSTFQDLNLELRYRLKTRPLVVTPSVALVLPSHNYEYFAHSAVGRDLREFRVGLNLGRRLDPVIRNAFVQGQFNYRFVEKVLNRSHNSSTAEAQLGYFVSRRLAVMGLGTWTDTYGGLSYWDPAELSAEEWRHHDQLDHVRLLNVGGGATYQFNPRFAVFGAAVHTFAGANAHALAYGITMGANWTIQTRGEGRKMARNQALGGDDTVAQRRCMCPKK